MIYRSQRLFTILIGAFFLVIAGGNLAQWHAAEPAKLVINQVGYLPTSPKVAFLVNSDTAHFIRSRWRIRT